MNAKKIENKNKLLKGIDNDTWHSFKLIALKLDIKLHQAFKKIVEFYILKNFK